MKENTFDRIAKIALIIIGSVFLVVCTIGAVSISNSLFGNPITKNNVKNTVIEYINENYPDDNCYIEDIWYDGKYEHYGVHILSSTDEEIDLTRYYNQDGEYVGNSYY